ncbi:MAG: hypothetical protein ACXW1M_04910, partial [Acidimicrobiia bacterium]
MAETRPPLAELVRLLAEEPALVAAAPGSAPVIAVPDAARALFTAGLVDLGARRPVLVAVPTGNEAERIAHDLGAFLPADDVELFPA